MIIRKMVKGDEGLEVEPDNETADRVYRRCGYTELGYRQLIKDI